MKKRIALISSILLVLTVIVCLFSSPAAAELSYAEQRAEDLWNGGEIIKATQAVVHNEYIDLTTDHSGTLGVGGSFEVQNGKLILTDVGNRMNGEKFVIQPLDGGLWIEINNGGKETPIVFNNRKINDAKLTGHMPMIITSSEEEGGGVVLTGTIENNHGELILMGNVGAKIVQENGYHDMIVRPYVYKENGNDVALPDCYGMGYDLIIGTSRDVYLEGKGSGGIIENRSGSIILAGSGTITMKNNYGPNLYGGTCLAISTAAKNDSSLRILESANVNLITSGGNAVNFDHVVTGTNDAVLINTTGTVKIDASYLSRYEWVCAFRIAYGSFRVKNGTVLINSHCTAYESQDVAKPAAFYWPAGLAIINTEQNDDAGLYMEGGEMVINAEETSEEAAPLTNAQIIGLHLRNSGVVKLSGDAKLSLHTEGKNIQSQLMYIGSASGTGALHIEDNARLYGEIRDDSMLNAIKINNGAASSWQGKAGIWMSGGQMEILAHDYAIVSNTQALEHTIDISDGVALIRSENNRIFGCNPDKADAFSSIEDGSYQFVGPLQGNGDSPNDRVNLNSLADGWAYFGNDADYTYYNGLLAHRDEMEGWDEIEHDAGVITTYDEETGFYRYKLPAKGFYKINGDVIDWSKSAIFAAEKPFSLAMSTATEKNIQNGFVYLNEGNGTSLSLIDDPTDDKPFVYTASAGTVSFKSSTTAPDITIHNLTAEKLHPYIPIGFTLTVKGENVFTSTTNNVLWGYSVGEMTVRDDNDPNTADKLTVTTTGNYALGNQDNHLIFAGAVELDVTANYGNIHAGSSKDITIQDQVRIRAVSNTRGNETLYSGGHVYIYGGHITTNRLRGSAGITIDGTPYNPETGEGIYVKAETAETAINTDHNLTVRGATIEAIADVRYAIHAKGTISIQNSTVTAKVLFSPKDHYNPADTAASCKVGNYAIYADQGITIKDCNTLDGAPDISVEGGNSYLIQAKAGGIRLTNADVKVKTNFGEAELAWAQENLSDGTKGDAATWTGKKREFIRAGGGCLVVAKSGGITVDGGSLVVEGFNESAIQVDGDTGLLVKGGAYVKATQSTTLSANGKHTEVHSTTAGQNLVSSFDGLNLNAHNTIRINQGGMTVTGDSTVVVEGYSSALYSSSSTVTVESGTLTVKADRYATNIATLQSNGGTLNTTALTSNALYATTVNVAGGTVNATAAGNYAIYTSTFNATAGTVNAIATPVYYTGVLNVITYNQPANSTATVNLTIDKFATSGDRAIGLCFRSGQSGSGTFAGGTLNIRETNPVVSSYNHAIWTNKSNLTFSGTNLNVDLTENQYLSGSAGLLSAIRLQAGADATVTGGTIHVRGNKNSSVFRVDNNDCVLSLNGGTVTGSVGYFVSGNNDTTASTVLAVEGEEAKVSVPKIDVYCMAAVKTGMNTATFTGVTENVWLTGAEWSKTGAHWLTTGNWGDANDATLTLTLKNSSTVALSVAGTRAYPTSGQPWVTMDALGNVTFENIADGEITKASSSGALNATVPAGVTAHMGTLSVADAIRSVGATTLQGDGTLILKSSTRAAYAAGGPLTIQGNLNLEALINGSQGLRSEEMVTIKDNVTAVIQAKGYAVHGSGNLNGNGGVAFLGNAKIYLGVTKDSTVDTETGALNFTAGTYYGTYTVQTNGANGIEIDGATVLAYGTSRGIFHINNANASIRIVSGTVALLNADTAEYAEAIRTQAGNVEIGKSDSGKKATLITQANRHAITADAGNVSIQNAEVRITSAKTHALRAKQNITIGSLNANDKTVLHVTANSNTIFTDTGSITINGVAGETGHTTDVYASSATYEGIIAKTDITVNGAKVFASVQREGGIHTTAGNYLQKGDADVTIDMHGTGYGPNINGGGLVVIGNAEIQSGTLNVTVNRSAGKFGSIHVTGNYVQSGGTVSATGTINNNTYTLGGLYVGGNATVSDGKLTVNTSLTGQKTDLSKIAASVAVMGNGVDSAFTVSGGEVIVTATGDGNISAPVYLNQASLKISGSGKLAVYASGTYFEGTIGESRFIPGAITLHPGRLEVTDTANLFVRATNIRGITLFVPNTMRDNTDGLKDAWGTFGGAYFNGGQAEIISLYQMPFTVHSEDGDNSRSAYADNYNFNGGVVLAQSVSKYASSIAFNGAMSADRIYVGAVGRTVGEAVSEYDRANLDPSVLKWAFWGNNANYQYYNPLAQGDGVLVSGNDTDGYTFLAPFTTSATHKGQYSVDGDVLAMTTLDATKRPTNPTVKMVNDQTYAEGLHIRDKEKVVTLLKGTEDWNKSYKDGMITYDAATGEAVFDNVSDVHRIADYGKNVAVTLLGDSLLTNDTNSKVLYAKNGSITLKGEGTLTVNATAVTSTDSAAVLIDQGSLKVLGGTLNVNAALITEQTYDANDKFVDHGKFGAAVAVLAASTDQGLIINGGNVTVKSTTANDATGAPGATILVHYGIVDVTNGNLALYNYGQNHSYKGGDAAGSAANLYPGAFRVNEGAKVYVYHQTVRGIRFTTDANMETGGTSAHWRENGGLKVSGGQLEVYSATSSGIPIGTTAGLNGDAKGSYTHNVDLSGGVVLLYVQPGTKYAFDTPIYHGSNSADAVKNALFVGNTGRPYSISPATSGTNIFDRKWNDLQDITPTQTWIYWSDSAAYQYYNPLNEGTGVLVNPDANGNYVFVTPISTDGTKGMYQFNNNQKVLAKGETVTFSVNPVIRLVDGGSDGYSADILWTEMSFEYDPGVWSPESHTYEGRGWHHVVDGEPSAATVTVINRGTAPLHASMEYNGKEEYEDLFRVTVSSESEKVPSTDAYLLTGTDGEVTFTVSVEAEVPEESMTDVVIGTLTLSLSHVPEWDDAEDHRFLAVNSATGRIEVYDAKDLLALFSGESTSVTADLLSLRKESYPADATATITNLTAAKWRKPTSATVGGLTGSEEGFLIACGSLGNITVVDLANYDESDPNNVQGVYAFQTPVAGAHDVEMLPNGDLVIASTSNQTLYYLPLSQMAAMPTGIIAEGSYTELKLYPSVSGDGHGIFYDPQGFLWVLMDTRISKILIDGYGTALPTLRHATDGEGKDVSCIFAPDDFAAHTFCPVPGAPGKYYFTAGRATWIFDSATLTYEKAPLVYQCGEKGIGCAAPDSDNGAVKGIACFADGTAVLVPGNYNQATGDPYYESGGLHLAVWKDGIPTHYQIADGNCSFYKVFPLTPDYQ